MVERFRVEDLNRASPGLTHKDILLLALMAGGDYDEGITGCGSATALEIARADYANRLYDLLRRDLPVESWQQELVHELSTNHKGRFSCKREQLAGKIGPAFPDKKSQTTISNRLSQRTRS